MPPLRGFGDGGGAFLYRCCRNTQANKPYAIQEGVGVFEVFVENPVPLPSNRWGFSSFQTAPTGPGSAVTNLKRFQERFCSPVGAKSL